MNSEISPACLTIQQGIGLIEVLVALVLLTIAVMGYSTLQMQAIHATQEAAQHIQAMNLAHDLAERMRVNHSGLSRYAQSKAIEQTSFSCVAAFCHAEQMADYDLSLIAQKAKNAAMKVAVLPCQNMVQARQCIYVAWGNTTPSDGNTPTDCTNGARYVMHSRCLILEAYQGAK